MRLARHRGLDLQQEPWLGVQGQFEQRQNVHQKDVRVRYRSVGVRLGKGEALADILASSSQVAEGVATAGVVVSLARTYRVSLPVLTAVAQVSARLACYFSTLETPLQGFPKL